MSKIIKVLDNNLIEISDYRCPEVIFNNGQIPPTLQDIKNEMENLEWYCVFKETINPFELYAQNEKYKIVLDKIKEYIKDNGIDEEMVECCDRYDINGIEIYKLFEEIE